MGGGGVPTFLSGGGGTYLPRSGQGDTYLPRSRWGGGVPTFPGLEGYLHSKVGGYLC